MNLEEDLREFVELLNALNVHYLVVGAHAVGYYGYPRATADIDIWIAINPANAKMIASASGRLKDLNDLEHLE